MSDEIQKELREEYEKVTGEYLGNTLEPAFYVQAVNDLVDNGLTLSELEAGALRAVRSSLEGTVVNTDYDDE